MRFIDIMMLTCRFQMMVVPSNEQDAMYDEHGEIAICCIE